VQGCGEELVNAKAYYKRYRICPIHCNIECLVIEGQNVRFCQQCGTFHDIKEFEGRRKSCKRKLAQHNKRRRKTKKDDKINVDIQVAEKQASVPDPKVRDSQHPMNNLARADLEPMEAEFANGNGNGTLAGIKPSANLSKSEEKYAAKDDEVSVCLLSFTFFSLVPLLCY
jgi:hypothetical protein